MAPIHLKFESRLRWHVHSAFAPNAYPASAQALVEACSDRLFAFYCNLNAVRSAVASDREELVRALDEREKAEPGTLRELARRSDHASATFEGEQFIPSMLGLLASLKSLLDVYTRLMGQLIGVKDLRSFGKGDVGAHKQLAGGKVINWLRRSAPKEFTNAERLADVLEYSSRYWLTRVVGMRDQVIHNGNLGELTPMSVRLTDTDPAYTAATIQGAQLLGADLVKACDQMAVMLWMLCQATVPLLPGVDLTKISLGYPPATSSLDEALRYADQASAWLKRFPAKPA